MARKAAPFALRESDIPVLERMKADADHTQAQIANILLTCNEEPQIKKVAERLSVQENTVARWRSMYLQGGIDSVVAKKAGRHSADAELVEQVRNLVELTRNTIRWTPEELAKHFQVSERQMRAILKSGDITLVRSCVFNIPTKHTLTGNGRYLTGVYLSPDCQMLVYATYMLTPDDCGNSPIGASSDGNGAADVSVPVNEDDSTCSNTLSNGEGAVNSSSLLDDNSPPISQDACTHPSSPDLSFEPIRRLDPVHTGVRDLPREREMHAEIVKRQPLCLAEGSTAVGQVLTVDRKLKDTLEKSKGDLSLEDALYVATGQPIYSGRRNGLTSGEFLQKTLKLWDRFKDVHLDIFCCGSPPVQVVRHAWKYTSMHRCTSIDDMCSQVMAFKWDREPGNYMESYASMVNICDYIDETKPGDTAFCWQMLPCDSGIPDKDVEDWSATLLDILTEDLSLEEAIEHLVDDLNKQSIDYEAPTTVKAILMGRGEDGQIKYDIVDSTVDFPAFANFDLSTIESLDESINNLDHSACALGRRVDIAVRQFYTDKLKRKHLGVVLPIQIECCSTKMKMLAPLSLIQEYPQFAHGQRYLAADYRKAICELATSESLRQAHETFHSLRGRTEKKDQVPVSTFIQDIVQEGLRLIIAKNRAAEEVLRKFHMEELLSRALSRAEIPPKYLNDVIKWCEVQSTNESMARIQSCWDPESPDFQQLPQVEEVDSGPPPEEIIEQAEKELDIIMDECTQPGTETSEEEPPPEQYSQPDLREFVVRRKRRWRHKLVPPEEMSRVANDYVAWFNDNSGDDEIKISAGWKVEQDISNALYAAIDAVYVAYQSGTHIGGVKKELPKERVKISHWNISVEYDSHIYIISDTYLTHAMIQLVAFILENGLYKRYLIIFTDGETCIFEQINRFLSGWHHAVFLDLYHATTKIFEKLSLAIKSKRVVDPRGEHERYVRGPKKDQIKKAVMTSLSRLYARKAARFLYVGDIPRLISYLEHINPADVQNQSALNELIGYFKRKGIYCTCYALRRRLGLRNSSNIVEATNNRNTSARMKCHWMSWSVIGSGALVSLKSVKLNGETNMWYSHNQFTFRQPCFSQVMNAVNEPTVIRVNQMEKFTKETLEQYGPKNNPRASSNKTQSATKSKPSTKAKATSGKRGRKKKAATSDPPPASDGSANSTVVDNTVTASQ